MKLYIYCLYICLFTGLLSCQQNDEKSRLITRKWRVTFTTDQLLNTMSQSEKEFYKLIPEDVRKKELNSVIQTANDNTFEFKADHTFELVLKGQEVQERGTWSLEKVKDSYKLVLIKKTTNDTETLGREELIIKDLDKDKMIILIDSTKELILEPMQNDKI